MKVYTRTSTEESGVPEDIVPILGTKGAGGEPFTMDETVGIALGAASVCWDGNGVFQGERVDRIRNELMANIDQFASERVADHVKTQEEKRKAIMASGAWPDSTDAMVWAEMFCNQQKERNQPGNLALMGADPTDPGFMVSWFANAMGTASRKNDKLISDIRDYVQSRLDAAKITIQRDHVTFTNCTLVEIPYDESPPPIECIHGKHYPKDLPLPLAKGQIIRHTDCTFYGSGQAFSGSWANVKNEPPFELGGEFLRND